MTYDLACKEAINYLRAKQTWTASGSSDPLDLSPLSKGKGGKKGRSKGNGDKSAKPKECFSCGKLGHNKNECQELLSCPEEGICSARHGWSVRRCGSGSPDRQEKTFWGKGTGAVSPAPCLDACLLYEDDSDQDAYSLLTRVTTVRKIGWLCRASCFSIRELRGRCAQQRSDQMFQSNHQKKSHCIRRTARELLTSVPSSSAWVLVLRKSKEGST